MPPPPPPPKGRVNSRVPILPFSVDFISLKKMMIPEVGSFKSNVSCLLEPYESGFTPGTSRSFAIVVFLWISWMSFFTNSELGSSLYH